MLIEKFGTTRLNGERKDQCVTGRLLQKFTQYIIKKTVGRYMVKTRNMTLRQIVTNTC